MTIRKGSNIIAGTSQGDLNNKANISLDNLNTDGQMVIDSQNGTISNCILDIPQNIKLEIDSSNNRINIVLGSEVVVPNGDVYTTATTVTYPSSYNTKTNNSPSNKYVVMFWKSGNGCIVVPIEATFSGNTQPTTTYTKSYWYNTNDKFLYITNDTGQTWEKSVNGWTFPVCLVEVDSNNNYQFVKDSNDNDMIFNGAGFIGHHAFVYPNVSGLIASGFNEDGSLKSIEEKTNSLNIIDLTVLWPQADYANNKYITLVTYGQYVSTLPIGNDVETREDILLQPIQGSTRFYVKNENIIRNYTSTTPVTKFVHYKLDSNNMVTDFAIRQPVRLATTEMLDSGLSQKQDTLTGAATTIASFDLTASKALISNSSGKVAVSNVTDTELGYLSGVTSAVQTQINAKQATLTFDTAPTNASTNPVTSGGVYTALSAKADSSMFQVVSALPASPDADTFYFIPES